MMNDIPENIDRQLNETLGIDGDEEQVQEYTPSYRVLGDTKIPISKAEGKLWKTRKDQAATVMKDVTEQWDLTYKYFNGFMKKINNRILLIIQLIKATALISLYKIILKQ